MGNPVKKTNDPPQNQCKIPVISYKNLSNHTIYIIIHYKNFEYENFIL